MTFVPDMDFIKGLAKEGGWVDATNEIALTHLQNGYVKSDGEIDNDGDVFYTLTPAGLALVAPKPAPVGKIIPKVTAVRERPLPVVADTIDDGDHDWNKPPAAGGFRGRRQIERKSPVRDALGFDKLEIGQSRHIAATVQVPEPWKSYASTVNVENSRYATQRVDADGRPMVKLRKNRAGEQRPYPVWDYSRKFIIFRTQEGDPRGPGARLKRVDPAE